MMSWFMAGGFGMYLILILGAGAIGFGAKVLGNPTEAGITRLRSLTSLLLAATAFSVGVNCWAVNVHISNDAFLKQHNITAAEGPLVALMGITEAIQPLTFAGLVLLVVLALRMLAEGKLAKRTAS